LTVASAPNALVARSNTSAAPQNPLRVAHALTNDSPSSSDASLILSMTIVCQAVAKHS
jgi:hypothetical protein